MQEKGLYQERMTEKLCDSIYQAAPLHDIGKIRIPDSILCKAGRLTDEEMAKIVALYHHEKWDGTGYPAGMAGEEIPIGARIMAVADVFDALISKRRYKESMGYEQAFQIIENGKGTHFDPYIVHVFLEQKETIIHICEQANRHPKT